MAKSLSIDLRKRVVAVIASGMSRRRATERFGVSAASAIRWPQQFNQTGTVEPDKQGGDRRSHQIDAHKATILALYEAKTNITLEEIRSALADKGIRAGRRHPEKGPRIRHWGAPEAD